MSCINEAHPNGKPSSPEGDSRALALLWETRDRQRNLPREAALAWERAAFAEAFESPEPGRRVRAFLEGGRMKDEG